MFFRLATSRALDLARTFPAVVLLGARQVGKTTLARAAFPHHTYVDLEEPRTRDLFDEDPTFHLDQRLRLAVAREPSGGLILDEAQSVPQVFASLRGLIDADRHARGRFILLGSAQPALVRGVSESLAGRAGVLELDPLTAHEAATGPHPKTWRDCWLSGGYPEPLLSASSASGAMSRDWHEAYLRTYIERDLPMLGLAAEPVFLRRLLTMLAHQQGGLLNVNALAGALGVPHAKVARCLDLFEQTFMLRRLHPWFTNIGKRLVRSPKAYLRDTGLVHHLLGIGDLDGLLQHPIRGQTWETFVVECLIRTEKILRPHTQAWFWRTAAGAEVDLVLERGAERIAIEVKSAPGSRQVARHLADCAEDIGANRAWIIDQGDGREPLNARVTRVGIEALVAGGWEGM